MSMNAKVKITFQGNPLTLVGRNINVGIKAPDFRVVDTNLQDVTLENFPGKIKILTSFPSLDTPVCDLQVKEFNKRASAISPEEVVVIGISKDLPFAQSRFCTTNEIKNVHVFSDFMYSSFGINYGLLIKENNLLARSVTILDKNNIIRYVQIVNELTSPPNYDEVIKALQEVIKAKPIELSDTTPTKCVPCESGTPPLPKDKIEKLMKESPNWQIVEDKKIVREFKFRDFVEAKYFLDMLAVIAEEQGHHPSFNLIYNKLKVTLSTHAASGLTDNDFVMAKIIDSVT